MSLGNLSIRKAASCIWDLVLNDSRDWVGYTSDKTSTFVILGVCDEHIELWAGCFFSCFHLPDIICLGNNSSWAGTKNVCYVFAIFSQSTFLIKIKYMCFGLQSLIHQVDVIPSICVSKIDLGNMETLKYFWPWLPTGKVETLSIKF